MIDIFKPRPPVQAWPKLEATALASDQKAAEALAERRRLADTDGTRRRMRQQVEDNRLR